MHKSIYYIFTVGFFLFLSGCAGFVDQAAEPFRTVWGSSTRALEKARSTAISKIYYCSFEDCFNATVSLGRDWDADAEPKRKELAEKQLAEKGLVVGDPPVDVTPPEAEMDDARRTAEALLTTKKFTVFIKDIRKKHLVIYNLPGSVDSTEVGVFFSPLDHGKVKIDISSLSTNAKRTASEIIFPELSQHFKEAVK